MPLEYTSLKNSSWSIRDDESLMVISCNRDLELWEGGWFEGKLEYICWKFDGFIWNC